MFFCLNMCNIQKNKIDYIHKIQKIKNKMNENNSRNRLKKIIFMHFTISNEILFSNLNIGDATEFMQYYFVVIHYLNVRDLK